MPRTSNLALKRPLPLVNLIQKLTIYETSQSFYLIGSNSSETVFKVLKIDRTCDPSSLSLNEDFNEYDINGIKSLISAISVENISTVSSSKKIPNSAILRTINALALLGFVKFLEGYYMVLVTKKLPVAVLGYHVIYTIDEVNMIYIPYVEKSSAKDANLDEQKYVKMFQSIDLRQNFYFSYSYDLTNTLQQNASEYQQPTSSESSGEQQPDEVKYVGVRNKPYTKFLWNEFLLKPIINKVSNQWVVYLVHGYLAQSSFNIFGCTVLVTLISRRSQRYAGTRFLKRGGTNEGYVANEVETEQIVHNASISSFLHGHFTSFVHIRGSIPLFWSQDPKAVPKPPINIDIVDPFATVAARHFKQLFARFGGPIIIVNLVKMREKKAQESILAEEYRLCIEYLKQFLPSEEYFQYICFDMAKLNKTDKGQVMSKLYDIAESCVEKTRFFQSFAPFFANERASMTTNTGFATSKSSSRSFKGVKQTGVVRVNCIDCLDRTNTAMYVIGKCALAHQLYALGIISAPALGPDSVCERMLIDLYEKSGDAIAQQYAGSQLVHRVDTYGKNSGLASQSRDMIHTISRYYSNAFADADKQNAMNVFLGIFEPSLNNFHIWDLLMDSYLHDPYIMQPWKLSKRYIEWFDAKIFHCLPFSSDQEYKSFQSIWQVENVSDKEDEKVSGFDNLYRPFELIAFSDLFYFNNLNINRITNTTLGGGSFSGNLKAIFDPFRSKRKSDTSSVASLNASITPNLSSSILQQSSDEDTDESYNFFQDISFKQINSKDQKSIAAVTSPSIHNEKLTCDINDTSMHLYKAYADDAKKFQQQKDERRRTTLPMSPVSSTAMFIASPTRTEQDDKATKQQPYVLNKVNKTSAFNNITFSGDRQSTYFSCNVVSEEAKSIYSAYLDIGMKGPRIPNETTLLLYKDYVCQRRRSPNDDDYITVT